MRSLACVLASLALATVQLSCASLRGGSSASSASPLVDRALAAQGGADAVGRLRTLTVKASATYWEPEQSVKPGGEPRLAGDATIALSRDLDAGTARIEWTRKLAYPAPREYRYTEIVTPAAGLVQGIDTTARTKQSQDSSPPQHAMSGLRLAATQRELQRASPRLLLELRANPAAVAPAPDQQAGGAALPAVSYKSASGVTFLVLFDRATSLPARIRTLDADNIHGDSIYDLVLEDWRDVSGVRLAHRQRYELNGTPIARIQYDEVQANPQLAAQTFDVPAELRAAAAKPAAGPVPYQWVLRRQHIGAYLDSDAVHYDPQASPGLRLVEIAPGVQHVQGGSHNSLVVEMADHLIVFDAPIDARQSRFTLDAARAKHPGKPVRFLVLTHHHMDHAGGTRAFVAEGATLLVGAGAGEHFRRVLARPDSIAAGAQGHTTRQAEVVEVQDRKTLGDGKRAVEVLRIENPHAEGMLLGYVADAKLGFVADLWSPGRDKLGDALTPGQAAVVSAVTKAGLSPERFAGGHGAVADYAPLAALASRR